MRTLCVLFFLAIQLNAPGARAEEPAPPVQPSSPEKLKTLSAEELEKLTALLASDDFALRTTAFTALLDADKLALPHITKALEKTTDLDHKALLSKLVNLCDSGGEIQNGVSVKLIADKTEYVLGGEMKLTARFINHTNHALIVPVGRRSQVLGKKIIPYPKLLDAKTTVDFRTPRVLPPMKVQVEIPALSFLDYTFTIALHYNTTPAKPAPLVLRVREQEEKGFVETFLDSNEKTLRHLYWTPGRMGEHLLSITTERNSGFPALEDDPRRVYGLDGLFSSGAAHWDGEIFSNEVKVTIKEK